MDTLSPDCHVAEARLRIPAARAVDAAARTVPDSDRQAAPFADMRTALISDALLEPHLAEARDRRASYLSGGFPIVSALLLLLIICVGWFS